MAHEEHFETSDIYLAAYLKIAGCELVRRRKIGSRVMFVFTNPAGPIKGLREAFFDSSGSVSAKRFSDEVKAMKELCFDPD